MRNLKMILTHTKRYLLLFTILLFFPSKTEAFWWALNYIPTADSWYEKTLVFQFCEYGYTEGKIYGFKNNSFGSSDAQIYSVSLGLPSIKFGDQWKIDSDVGVDFFRPHSDYYDDSAFNFKIKFIQDSQFNSFSPAVAFGGAYLGGGFDLYIHPSDPHAPFYPKRAVRESHTSEAFYLVGSKNIPVKFIEPQITAGFMWNNFGQSKEDVVIVGLCGWALPHKLLLMGDYYGGRFGNFGLGAYVFPYENFEIGISYFFPKDKDYPVKNYQSEALWLYVNILVPVKF